MVWIMTSGTRKRDRLIDHNYSREIPAAAAAEQNTPCLESLGLPLKPDTPLLGMVSRLDPQKGIDLAFESLRNLEEPDWQFVLVGTGNPELENAARKLQADFPDQVWVVLRYDDAMARQVYAGADLLLMPSRYEPCGLAQIDRHALRLYAGGHTALAACRIRSSIPRMGAVRPVSCSETVSLDAYRIAITRALKEYRDASKWRSIQKRAMQQDFSWEKSAEKYLKLYHSLTGK